MDTLDTVLALIMGILSLIEWLHSRYLAWHGRLPEAALACVNAVWIALLALSIRLAAFSEWMGFPMRLGA